MYKCLQYAPDLAVISSISAQAPAKYHIWALNISHLGVYPSLVFDQVFHALPNNRMFEPGHTWTPDHQRTFRKKNQVRLRQHG